MNAFLFDIDDTLYARWEPFYTACVRFLPSLASLSPQALYAARKKYSDFSFEEHQAGRMTKQEMYLYRTRHTMQDFGITLSDREALKLEEHYAEALSCIRLDKKLEEILSFLKEKNYILGIITNGPAKRQQDKFNALGLSRYIPFSHCIISGAAGMAKPDIRIFQTAQAHIGFLPEEACYIGDHYDADIVGAKAAGWSALWFDRNRQGLSGKNPLPDFTVSSYDAMYEVIRKIDGA